MRLKCTKGGSPCKSFQRRIFELFWTTLTPVKMLEERLLYARRGVVGERTTFKKDFPMNVKEVLCLLASVCFRPYFRPNAYVQFTSRWACNHVPEPTSHCPRQIEWYHCVVNEQPTHLAGCICVWYLIPTNDRGCLRC